MTSTDLIQSILTSIATLTRSGADLEPYKDDLKQIDEDLDFLVDEVKGL